METQILTDSDGAKKVVYKYFVPLSGIYEQTEAQIYESIEKKLDEARDATYVLFSVSFEDDRMVMSIDIDDIKKQKSVIKSMLHKIATNHKDLRMFIPDTGENPDNHIHIMYGREWAAFNRKYFGKGVKHDTQTV